MATIDSDNNNIWLPLAILFLILLAIGTALFLRLQSTVHRLHRQVHRIRERSPDHGAKGDRGRPGRRGPMGPKGDIGATGSSGSSDLTVVGPVDVPMTLAGPWADPQTTNWTYYKVGRTVQVTIPPVLADATIASGIFSATTIPTEFIPVSSFGVGFVVPVIDDGLLISGLLTVDTVGNVIVGLFPNQGPFTGSGNTGLFPTTLQWLGPP